MLAESLMEIREAKVSLTRGTAETMPTDGRQLELMLESLRHQGGRPHLCLHRNILFRNPVALVHCHT